MVPWLPVALVGFCTVVGLVLGSWPIGLAVGLGIVIVATLV
jgi:hypothetical protein